LGYHGITDCHKAGNVLCDLLGIIVVDFHVTDQLMSILNLSYRYLRASIIVYKLGLVCAVPSKLRVVRLI